MLGYYGTVEDHSKGTLHCHFILYGGLDPQLLQTYAGHQGICDTISETLDEIYAAELPRDAIIPHVVEQELRDRGLHVCTGKNAKLV